MRVRNSSTQLEAVIVGSRPDKFVEYALKLFDRCAIDYVLYDNLYAAAARLAQKKGRNVVVVGRMQQLSKEAGRLFEKIRKYGMSCCCLAEKLPAGDRKAVLAAMQAGTRIISTPVETVGVIEGLLADNVKRRDKMKASRRTTFIREEYLTTGAEIEALLEV